MKDLVGGLLYTIIGLLLPPILAIVAAYCCFNLLETDLISVKIAASMAIGFSTGIFTSALAIISAFIVDVFAGIKEPDTSQSYMMGVGCFSLIICGSLSLFTSGFTALLLSRS